MKKNEYLTPEVEIVEIMEQSNLLAGSWGDENAGGGGSGPLPGGGEIDE